MMQLRLSWPLCLAAFFMTAVAPDVAQTPAHPHWVGSWAASTMAADTTFGGLRSLCGDTLRQIEHVSIGGSRIRVRFSNAFGIDPLTINDAHVALSAGGAKIEAGGDRTLTFGGSKTVTIPAGAEIYSDPVDLNVAPLSNLAVSFFVPEQVMRAETYHWAGHEHNFAVSGNTPAAIDLAQPTTFNAWYFLDGVDVAAAGDARAVIALGDSITNGPLATQTGHHDWPNYLAERLQQDPSLRHVAVLNEGIAGNRVLSDWIGPNALSRLDRDVLSQDGAKYVIVLESINDIGFAARPQSVSHSLSAAPVDAAQLEFGMEQIAEAAHAHGMKAYAATLTPFQGAVYYSENGEKTRDALNQWIRTSGVFDAVIDFSKATQDPADPLRYNPKYDSGDHLHPNDAGYRAMANAIDLALFAK